MEKLNEIFLKINEIVRAIGYETPRFIRILCIDDSAQDIDLLKRILKEPNYTVYELEHVTNSDIALKRLKYDKYDVVLVDFLIPGSLNGVEVIKAAYEQGCNLPFIIFSGYEEESYFLAALRENVSGYLPKNALLFGASAARTVFDNIIRFSIKNHRINKSAVDFLSTYHKLKLDEKTIL